MCLDHLRLPQQEQGNILVLYLLPLSEQGQEGVVEVSSIMQLCRSEGVRPPLALITCLLTLTHVQICTGVCVLYLLYSCSVKIDL